MQTHLFESPAKLSVPCKTGKELELQVSIASVFTYNDRFTAVYMLDKFLKNVC